MTEIMHSEERRENECRNANGTFEGHHTNTRVMGMPEERKERKKKHRKIFKEIMAENSPNLTKSIILHIHEAQ